MQTRQNLKDTLLQIDGRGYKSYKEIDTPRQQVLERTAVRVTDEYVEARLFI